MKQVGRDAGIGMGWQLDYGGVEALVSLASATTTASNPGASIVYVKFVMEFGLVVR